MERSKISSKRVDLPDPRDHDAFKEWLTLHPPEWSMVIAARAALRVLPLVRAKNLPAVILNVFRATAISRFAARFPNRVTASQAAAAAAAATASANPGSFVSTSPVGTARAFSAARAARVASSARAIRAASAAASSSSSNYSIADRVNYASIAASAAADASAYGVISAAAAIRQDADALVSGRLSSEQLASVVLWPANTEPFASQWIELKSELLKRGKHWWVWIDWYDGVLSGKSLLLESQDEVFAGVSDELPWHSAKAVNVEIARRLGQIHEEERTLRSKSETIDRLAEVASPQPSINEKGQLDAGPNKPYDVPFVDDDLSTLPSRQRNLIAGILSDLPSNAPKHLTYHLRSYDGELKTRGTQPILGLLKDDADIIAAAVGAANAEDEWLEPGQRKQFERFAENHAKFVEHFPLDAEREDLYAQTEVDEDNAVGRDFVKPFEDVKGQAEEAVKSGAATSDLLAVMDKMTEFARVVSTQPPPQQTPRAPSASSEIRISPEDRVGSVTTKKRVILGSLGFLVATYNLIGTTVSLATTNYAGLASALHTAIQMLSSLLL